VVAILALVGMTVSVASGAVLLWRWRGRPRSTWVHLASAGIAWAGWATYLAAGRPSWLAWTVLAWLLLVLYPLGDLLMVGGRLSGRQGYITAARSVLSGRRPVATVHALLAPTVLVLVVIAALD
jgi:hypothetical protein